MTTLFIFFMGFVFLMVVSAALIAGGVILNDDEPEHSTGGAVTVPDVIRVPTAESRAPGRAKQAALASAQAWTDARIDQVADRIVEEVAGDRETIGSLAKGLLSEQIEERVKFSFGTPQPIYQTGKTGPFGIELIGWWVPVEANVEGPLALPLHDPIVYDATLSLALYVDSSGRAVVDVAVRGSDLGLNSVPFAFGVWLS